MILKKLDIHYFGPFFVPQTLEVDPHVTILTGQNDVGKSAILRLIHHICSAQPVGEDDRNIDRIIQAGVSPDKDGEIRCNATFILNHGIGQFVATGNVDRYSEVEIQFELNTGKRKVIAARNRNGGNVVVTSGEVHRMPIILELTGSDSLPSTIQCESLSKIEDRFLELALGKNGVEKLLPTMSAPIFRTTLYRANERINSELQKIVPETLGLRLRLDAESREPLVFTVSLVDVNEGHTPIHLRGSGIQKIVSLLVTLSAIDLDWEQLYILIDEPENSLHADAQHRLRSLLEQIARDDRIQVIYATHSPSMINQVRIKGLRLLERKNIGGVITTTINNHPFDDNFQRVRRSLGITPSDSLLYAPITIIIEGPTEVVCLPTLIWRLFDEEVDGFEKLDHLLSLTHFLNGFGDSFEYMCRLAKSQGAKPIIFVDGDKIRRVNQSSVRERHSDVPIIHLEEGTEFEEIVPKEQYFEALASLHQDDTITLELFENWNTTAGLHEKMMFSKRVERWLQDEFKIMDFDKPQTMKKALELTTTGEIQTEKIQELVTAIDNLLKKD